MTWTDVAETMARYTGLDAASLLDLGPTGFNPNGLPNQDSLLYCYQFFRGEGLITTAVPEQTLATVFGTDLVDEVLAEMGRLPEKLEAPGGNLGAHRSPGADGGARRHARASTPPSPQALDRVGRLPGVRAPCLCRPPPAVPLHSPGVTPRP